MAVKNVLYKFSGDDSDIKAAIARIKKEVAGISIETEKSKKSFDFKGALGSAGIVLGAAAAAAAIGKLGTVALDAGKNYETLKISFATFLGSAAKGEKVLKDLKKAADISPNTANEYFTAGKALVAFGIDTKNLIPTLNQISDISAGTGKNFNELAVIYGKAKVAGVLYAEDINQLVEAGVPILDEFAKTLGKPVSQVKKLASEGKISFDVFEKSFRSLTEEGGRFFELSKKLSESSLGLESTRDSALDDLAITFGEKLIPAYKDILILETEFIQLLKETPRFIEENKNVLLLLTSVLGFYLLSLTKINAATFVGLATKIKNIVIDRADAVGKTILAERTSFAAGAQKIFNKNADLTTISSALAGKAMRGLGNAAVAAGNSIKAAFLANPLGVILVAVQVLITAFDFLQSKADDLDSTLEKLITKEDAYKAIQKEAATAAGSEQTQLDLLFKSLKDKNLEDEKRNEIINKINSTYSITLKNLKDEKAFVDQNKEAYNKLKISIIGTAEAQATKNQLDLINGQILEKESSLRKVAREALAIDLINKKETDTEIKLRIKNLTTEDQNLLTNEIAKITKEATKRAADINSGNLQQDGAGAGLVFTDVTKDFSKPKNDEFFKAKNELIQLKKLRDELNESINETTPTTLDPITDPKTTGSTKKLLDLTKEIIDLKLENKTSPFTFINPDTIDQEILKLTEINDLAKEKLQIDLNQRIDASKKEGTFTVKNESDFATIKKLQEEKLDIDFLNKKNELIVKFELEKNKTIFEISRTQSEIDIIIALENTKKINEEREKLINQFDSAKNRDQEKAAEILLNNNLERLKISLEAEKQIKIKNAQEISKLEKDGQNTPEGKDLSGIKLKKTLLEIELDYIDKIDSARKKSNDKDFALRSARIDQIKSELNNLSQQILTSSKEIVGIEIQKTNDLINQQQRRVDEARDIADKGNVAQLQAEQERLNQLNERKRKFVKQQQALAQIEATLNLIVAVSKAAAQTGVAAPIAIAALLISYAAGIIKARELSNEGFFKGGYTGKGNKHNVAGKVHYDEFVMNSKATNRIGVSKLNDLMQDKISIDSFRGQPLMRGIERGADFERTLNYLLKSQEKKESVNIEKNFQNLIETINQKKGSTYNLKIDKYGINLMMENVSSEKDYINKKIKN